MASRRKLQLIVTLCFLTCMILPSKSGKTVGSLPSKTEEEMKLVLGSRPPRCTNRCMNCRPCSAVLVIPPHSKTSNQRQKMSSSSALTVTLTPQEEENYYLLSWKCRCKNKFFQP